MKQTIYLDTSVPSAYFDERNPERQELTKKFWKKLDRFDVLISTLVVREINKIKDEDKKKALFDLLKEARPLVIDEECEQLADEYIARGILSEKNRDDAVHIAVASVNAIDYLVSWNFEHIVKVKTRKLVELVDIEKDYKPIEILAPAEL